MQSIFVDLRYYRLNLAAVLSNVFLDWKSKFYLLLMSLFFLLLFSTTASAAVEGFVARSEEGCYHQYCYNQLLDSYANKIMGLSDGLYDDYKSKTPVAIYTNGNGFINYSSLLDHYAVTIKNGGNFDLVQYLQNGEADKALLPTQVMMVSLKSGSLIRIEETLSNDQANKDDKNDGKDDKADAESLAGKDPDNEQQDFEAKPELLTEPKRESETDLQALLTYITGSAKITESMATEWARSKNAHQRFIAAAPLYWKYGEKSGIRPEVLYAQAAHETGFGHYGGQVPPEYNNWAGIKTGTATGDEPEDHEQSTSPEEGVRVHFNHMSAYLGLSPIGETHDRYDVVKRISWAGSVEKIEDLSGKWAPSTTYHVKIVDMLKEMYQ